jgi:hypothetical protein
VCDGTTTPPGSRAAGALLTPGTERIQCCTGGHTQWSQTADYVDLGIIENLAHLQLPVERTIQIVIL